MSIKFEHHELLEFFDHEEIIAQKESIYSVSIKNDEYIFFILINTHEEFVVLTLKHKKITMPIFNIKINNVVKIETRADKERLCLRFFKNPDQKSIETLLPFLVLVIKPMVYFDWSL